MLKGIEKKPRANTVLNSDRLKSFPLKSGTRQGCLSAPTFLLSIIVEILLKAITHEKERKGSEM